MGSESSKLAYRNVFIQLTTKTQPVDANDNEFWEQFWADVNITAQDIFVLIPSAEIRALREESPNNLATLCYKAVERLSQIAVASFPSVKDQQIALNCVRLLTRLLPYMLEDPDWRSFFWSTLPGESESATDVECVPPAQILILALCDLLFCPDFTVHSLIKAGPEGPEDMQTIDSCEYIWQAGVGFAQTPAHNAAHDLNRTEILKLLLTCFSETMYLEREEAYHVQNKWTTFFTSASNRHALPLFASLLNVVCAYDPVGFGLPYNHLMFSDSREPLVETSLQVLCIVLDASNSADTTSPHRNLRHQVTNRLGSCSEDTTSSAGNGSASRTSMSEPENNEVNLFASYMSRIHRDEDFAFILSGLTRLLNNPLQQTYLPSSTKKVQMHQELLVLFWRMCEINKKFMYYVLKSSQVLDLLVPILYHLNDSRSDPTRLGLVHVGVFILLLLSGERNFGVRLNKPYKSRVSLDLPLFTGTHADLLILVFHKLITNGHRCLQPLFDCLITIIANVSPYLKTLSMVTANKLIHLLEAFSQPRFLYAAPTHYQLVFLLLEVFNNIIQYQFDGNSNLVYTLIRNRQVFYHLANLPTDKVSIQRIISRRSEPADKSSALSTPQSSPSHVSATSTSKTRTHNSVNTQRSTDTPVVQHSERELSVDNSSNKSVQLSNYDDSVNGDHNDKSGAPLESQPHTSVAPLEVGVMTDKQLADAADETSKNLKSLDGNNQPLENALVSHSSPSRFARSHSDGSADTPPKDRWSKTAHKHGSGSLAHLGLTDHQIGVNGDSDLQGKRPSVHQQMEPQTPEPRPCASSIHMNPKTVDSSTSHVPGQTLKSSDCSSELWSPSSAWASGWKAKMPFQTIMRLLQVLVPQVEKICIDKGLTDESEIVKFLQNGTLVGLLPVPHPILIRKYQSNAGTAVWFRNFLWGVIYLRNLSPPIWYDTNVRLFEIQRS